MEHLRVRLKIGEHEFEAEGPPADVDAQFTAFRALVCPRPLPLPAAEAPAQPLPVASPPADQLNDPLSNRLPSASLAKPSNPVSEIDGKSSCFSDVSVM